MKKLLSIVLSTVLLISISITAYANDEPPAAIAETGIIQTNGERTIGQGYIMDLEMTPEEIEADRKKFEKISPQYNLEGHAATRAVLQGVYTVFAQHIAAQFAIIGTQIDDFYKNNVTKLPIEIELFHSF